MEVNLSDLPAFTELVQCEKKDIKIRGKKIEIKYDSCTHIFFLCEFSEKCPHKTSCLYKFTNEYYFCEKCETLVCGLMGFKIKVKSRFCRNCGEIIEKSLMANSRLVGLRL